MFTPNLTGPKTFWKFQTRCVFRHEPSFIRLSFRSHLLFTSVLIIRLARFIQYDFHDSKSSIYSRLRNRFDNVFSWNVSTCYESKTVLNTSLIGILVETSRCITGWDGFNWQFVHTTYIQSLSTHSVIFHFPFARNTRRHTCHHTWPVR